MEVLVIVIILVLEESMGVDILKEKFTLADVVNELPAFVDHHIANCLLIYLLKLLLSDLQRVDEDKGETSGKHVLQANEVLNLSSYVIQEEVASDLDPEFIPPSNSKKSSSFLDLLPALNPTYFSKMARLFL